MPALFFAEIKSARSPQKVRDGGHSPTKIFLQVFIHVQPVGNRHTESASPHTTKFIKKKNSYVTARTK